MWDRNKAEISVFSRRKAAQYYQNIKLSCLSYNSSSPRIFKVVFKNFTDIVQQQGF